MSARLVVRRSATDTRCVVALSLYTYVLVFVAAAGVEEALDELDEVRVPAAARLHGCDDVVAVVKRPLLFVLGRLAHDALVRGRAGALDLDARRELGGVRLGDGGVDESGAAVRQRDGDVGACLVPARSFAFSVHVTWASRNVPLQRDARGGGVGATAARGARA